MNQNKKAFHPRGRRDRAETPPPPPPPGLAARVAAAAALADILGSGHSLEERFAADAAAGRQLAFDVRDRALIRSIVATSLRRLGTIRAALAQFLDKGLPKKAGSLEHTLIVGAAQLMFLDVPDHAAVDLAVRAVRADPKAAPFAAVANAVLRNIARARDDLREPADPFIDTPPWLAARWKKHWGAETAQRIALMHRHEPTLDLTVRSDLQAWAEKLGGVVLPTTGQARFEGDYAGVRVFENQSGLEYTRGDMVVAIDFEDFNDGPAVRGRITDRVAFDAEGDPIPLGGEGELVLPTLVFTIQGGTSTLNANGELAGQLTSSVLNEDGALQPYEEGTYYGIIAGDLTDPKDGGEIVGIIVIESQDPRYSGVTAQETGGFILYR